MGWSPTLTWLRWGPKYHLHRRALQPAFTKSKVRQYTAMQRKEALICCKSMIDDPANWLNAVRRCSVAIVLKIAYGLDVEGPESQWISLAEKSASAIGKAGAPGSSIMDLFPSSKSDAELRTSSGQMRDAASHLPLITRSSLPPGLAAVHGAPAIRPHLARCNSKYHRAPLQGVPEPDGTTFPAQQPWGRRPLILTPPFHLLGFESRPQILHAQRNCSLRGERQRKGPK